jgi:isoleucyl-tRNA synthetase
VRLLAPILSFTAEEIWSYLPGKHEPSVFLTTWYDRWPRIEKENMDAGFWDGVINVRGAVSRELERLRVAGGIGSALNAEVDLYCEPKLHETLVRLGHELRFVFICSEARVHALDERPTNAVETPVKGLAVQVAPSAHAKCARCWHQRPDVGSHPEHPLICGRCVQNIGGAGETRSYA